MPKLVNAHFCTYGYTFILEAISGYLLAALALFCFAALVYRTPRHIHRKALFFLLFTVGVVRGLFGQLGCNRIAKVDVYYDISMYIDWFFDWTIPLNMLGDLLTAYVDFLLTFFWLQFVAPRWSKGHWGTFVPIACCTITALLGFLVFVTDYHDLHADDDYNSGNIYARSLGYISALLLFSSLLHSVVVVKLLYDMLYHKEMVEEMSPRMRRNMVVVGVIGFISVLSGVMRGIVLLGHVSGEEIFVKGRLSFDDPTFFTVYIIGFMNAPCIAICLSFFVLSWRLIAARVMTGDGDQHSDDGVYSVVSDGDSVRVSFLRQYAYRMNSSFGGGGGGSFRHRYMDDSTTQQTGTYFGSTGDVTSIGGGTTSGGLPTNPRFSVGTAAAGNGSAVDQENGSTKSNPGSPGLASEGPLSTQHPQQQTPSSANNRIPSGRGGTIQTAAMFATRGPAMQGVFVPGATSSRSRRELAYDEPQDGGAPE